MFGTAYDTSPLRHSLQRVARRTNLDNFQAENALIDAGFDQDPLGAEKAVLDKFGVSAKSKAHARTFKYGAGYRRGVNVDAGYSSEEEVAPNPWPQALVRVYHKIKDAGHQVKIVDVARGLANEGWKYDHAGAEARFLARYNIHGVRSAGRSPRSRSLSPRSRNQSPRSWPRSSR